MIFEIRGGEYLLPIGTWEADAAPRLIARTDSRAAHLKYQVV